MAYFPLQNFWELLFTLEGMRRKKEAVHQAAKAPHIDAEGVGLAKDYFRCSTALGTDPQCERVSARSQLCSAAKVSNTG